MGSNKKPSWKERLSNWAPTTWDVQLVQLISVFLSGIAVGISLTLLLQSLR